MVIAFSLDSERYGIESRKIRAVVPLAKLKALDTTNTAVSGLLNFRGTDIPVINLCRLILGRACADYLSTRVLIADCCGVMVGLVVEQANETANVDYAHPPSTDHTKNFHMLKLAAEGDGHGVSKSIELGGMLRQALKAAAC